MKMPSDMIGKPAILNGELVALHIEERYIYANRYNDYFYHLILELDMNVFPIENEWVEFPLLTEEEKTNLRILSFEEWKELVRTREQPNENPNAFRNSQSYEELVERCERFNHRFG